MVKTFCLLPSFSDALALAATCRRLRNVWITNVGPIYSHVAPRSIPCERYARRFLADQGGPAVNVSTLSDKDVLRMLRNSCVVEQAILQFEKEIVSRVKGTLCPITRVGVHFTTLMIHFNKTAQGFRVEDIYGPGARKHPPHLTRTERPRFIRSYYQLWGLMKSDPAEWQSRLEPMTLKQLYHLSEMCALTQSIGREEVIPAPYFPNAAPGSALAINSRRSAERHALSFKVSKHLQIVYRRLHHRDAVDDPWVHAKREGYLWFVVLWDHWQPGLRELVYNRPDAESMVGSSGGDEVLWDDSTDEYELL